ncbi:hypothetical protein LX13_001723 [Williamsia maris]|uniref:Uncharacterized protein n=2 Tax=Williamsia maris TaxID=72806 RepID=A0ABT1HCB9_9NOCA|nr:hypothetical protein [Williamsia maris]
MLVWVRRNFHDGAVDVIPVVLDVELADEHTLLVPASRSPLLTDLAAVVTLRSHLHHEAFIDRVGSLDIASDIEEVVAAQRTGRLSPARVGPSIHAEDDERLEYRQALRDLLAELTPSAWTPSGVDTGPPSRSEIRPRAKERDRRWFERRVAERLPSASCILLEDESFTISPGAGLEPFSKVVYLDTAVLVLTVDSLERVQTRLSDLASACISAARSSPDADAVCVTERAGDWESLLFSQASLREALVLPSGTTAGPVAVLSGLGVMDTLWKHLEGSISAWEATDQSPGGLGAVDVASIASRHVLTSIGAVESQGRRAQQDAKKTTWTRLDPQLADRVSRFVTSVTGSTTPAEALSTFEREIRDDQDS